jgi:hypothetical protein
VLDRIGAAKAAAIEIADPDMTPEAAPAKPAEGKGREEGRQARCEEVQGQGRRRRRSGRLRRI